MDNAQLLLVSINGENCVYIVVNENCEKGQKGGVKDNELVLLGILLVNGLRMSMTFTK